MSEKMSSFTVFNDSPAKLLEWLLRLGSDDHFLACLRGGYKFGECRRRLRNTGHTAGDIAVVEQLAVLRAIEHQLEAVANFSLLEQARKIDLDGPLGQIHGGGDFLVLQSLRQKFHHLLLPLAEADTLLVGGVETGISDFDEHL